MVDVRAKGAKAETDIRNILRKHTGLGWERTPGSGALDPKHMLKGDLYIPNKDNIYCVECKHYEDDHVSTQLLTSKVPQLIEWWEQAVRQAKQVNRKPLLIFKHNRSKLFVAYQEMPMSEYRLIFINVLGHEFYIGLLEDWLIQENPKFIK
jgi:Holliday junction resolvase